MRSRCEICMNMGLAMKLLVHLKTVESTTNGCTHESR